MLAVNVTAPNSWSSNACKSLGAASVANHGGGVEMARCRDGLDGSRAIGLIPA
jgi:hypothetical protein